MPPVGSRGKFVLCLLPSSDVGRPRSLTALTPPILLASAVAQQKVSRGAKRKLEEETQEEVDAGDAAAAVAGDAEENKDEPAVAVAGGAAGGAGGSVLDAEGERAVIEVDDAQIAKALEEQVDDEGGEEEDAAKDSEDDDYEPPADDEQNAFLAEERRMRAENKRKAEEERKARKTMSQGEKTEQLNNLLQKAAAYTAFLRQRMQEGHTAEGVAGSGKPKAGKDGRDPRQPKLLSGETMRTYQVDGMVWISSLWENGLNGILADEMGLGKTCQTIAFFAHLYGMGVTGPFIVVAPLSTVPNWQREFKRFAPTIPTVLYHGSKEERRAIREEVGFERKIKHKADKKFPVVITSFEVAMNDSAKLQNLKWKYMVVDEGQRLKNKVCDMTPNHGPPKPWALNTVGEGKRLKREIVPILSKPREMFVAQNLLVPVCSTQLQDYGPPKSKCE